MKNVFEILLFPIVAIVLLFSGANGNSISGKHGFYPQLGQKDDTTGLIRLVRVDSFHLTVIPPSSGVQFYKDGIVFLSSSKLVRKMSQKHISFGSSEAYFATIEDSGPGRVTIFSPSSSFSYPCDAITFSRDFNIIYFTKFPGKEKKEKIFEAKASINLKNQLEWISEINPLDFCTDNSNYTHPTLASDEKMLIFASDKEGSSGGMDLYISRKIEDKWSSPENLGKMINTPKNEFFPFLDSDNNLFFSSNGLPGYGGYDIFTCKFNGVDWNKPVNLSDHINSRNDDIAFTIDKIDGKTAFFTRRQISDKTNMQLFKVTLSQEYGDHSILTVSYVFNGKPVPETNLIAAGTMTDVMPTEVKNPGTKPEIGVVKKDEVKVTETSLNPKEITRKEPVKKNKPMVSQSGDKVVIIKPSLPISVEQKDIVIYRVQFLTTDRPKVNKGTIIDGKNYTIFEYFYLGAYRFTIGEFRTLAPAVELQRICRQSGYPDAFVAAFKNDTRSLDLKNFK